MLDRPVSQTNIFCLIGKPGSGRETMLRSILDDKEFTNKYKIEKLVYGTTRPMKPTDINGETYHFMTKNDFLNLDPTEIIESRSYDPVFEDEYYYFTLKNYIKFECNYIGRVSVFQYEELKKWAEITQLKMPLLKINVYPIIINAGIFERERRIMNNASTSEDVYRMCIKFMSERYEFNEVAKNNPEIIDRRNPNTLIVDNKKSDKKYIPLLKEDIEKFISKKIIMQGN